MKDPKLIEMGTRGEAGASRQAAQPPGPTHTRQALDAIATAAAVCPQGDDCAGDGTPSRILDCEQGCGYRGCAACMKIHEDEPHVGDSDQMLAMIRDLGGTW